MNEDKNPQKDDWTDQQRSRHARAVVYTSFALIVTIFGLLYSVGQRLQTPLEKVFEVVDVPPPAPVIRTVREPKVPLIPSKLDPTTGLYVTRGVITNLVERNDLNGGKFQKNLYARTEYFLPQARQNCYFHHLIGPSDNAHTFSAGLNVVITYDASKRDICGTSKIVE